MQIIINNFNNKKENFDETNTVLRSYKKLLKNPHAKVLKINTRLKISLIYTILAIIFLTFICLKYKTKPIYYAALGICILAFLVVLKSVIVYYKNRIIKCSNKTDSIFTINDEKIELNNKTLNAIYSVKWEDIEQILVFKNSILFMPKFEKMSTTVLISLPKEYEKEIINALEKCNKKDLIIYNK